MVKLKTAEDVDDFLHRCQALKKTHRLEELVEIWATEISPIELNMQSTNSTTPLMYVCGNLHKTPACVDALFLRPGLRMEEIDPNVQDRHGWTALAKACHTPNLNAVGHLLCHLEIKANLTNRKGNSPLAEACKVGAVRIVQILLPHLCYADIIHHNKAGKTPEDLVGTLCDDNHDEILKLLDKACMEKFGHHE